MKTSVIIGVMILSSFCFAQSEMEQQYLNDKDMPYYKNDSFAGKNKLERIDDLVKQMNIVMGDMKAMKAEIATLKQEIETLKNKK